MPRPTKVHRQGLSFFATAMTAVVVGAIGFAAIVLLSRAQQDSVPNPRKETNTAAIVRIGADIDSADSPQAALDVINKEACRLQDSEPGYKYTDPVLSARFYWLGATYGTIYKDLSPSAARDLMQAPDGGKYCKLGAN